jgi:signal transduction histidine kinase
MTEAGSRDLLDELGVRSIIVVPMIARNHVLGAIMLVSANETDRFGVNDLALAEDLAFHAALAIDNARLYQEAQRANQTKSDFLAVISHDLRTPLNAIVGYADLLDEGIPDPLSDRSRESVRRIRTSAKHLHYLIKELLAFARLDAGHEDALLREVDACEVVRDVAAVVDPIASERHLFLRVNLPDAAVSLTTDADKLRQILLNLVGNAVKYTEQGEVRLEVREHSLEGVVINVQDTGVGIAPEHIDRIFEPFWQVDPTQRTRGGGTGLGLSVVRRLVQLLGGAISVRSTVGVGSTFTVTLPRAAAAQ